MFLLSEGSFPEIAPVARLIIMPGGDCNNWYCEIVPLAFVAVT
jgi:hypothetical protein